MKTIYATVKQRVKMGIAPILIQTARPLVTVQVGAVVVLKVINP